MFQQHIIEWDVKLWTYVLSYKGKQYVLNVNSISKAYELFELIKYKLEKNENTIC